MLQPPKPPITFFPSSPAGSDFTPREEFRQTLPRQPSTFALLVFSSNNAIRLSNFPQALVTSLRAHLHTVVSLQSFRENAEHTLAEILLSGKPWSISRSLSTEIVLVQVFNVLVAHGYSFVSQIDYGREYSDRLSLAFSKLVPLPGQSQVSTQPQSVTFALSFPSSTILRVVRPPLHSTPAILQSVRSAWPRGVTNEKKLAEGCYEFKLKGYSWFSEDTFPEDSLEHMLTILTALDRLNCTLLTSLTLTASRSRNKDLWLFSTPGPGSSSPTDSDANIITENPVRLGSRLEHSTYEPIVDHVVEGSGDSETTGSPETRKFSPNAHERFSSEPAILRRNQHIPTATDDDALPNAYTQSHDILSGPSLDGMSPTPRPSAISRSQVATIHVSDLPQHFPRQDPRSGPQPPIGVPPTHSLVSLPEAIERHPTDEDFLRIDTAASPGGNARYSTTSTPTIHPSRLPTPAPLSPIVFRTSSFEPRDSTATGHSFEVPITWIPFDAAPPPSAFLNVDAKGDADSSSITTGPLLPGAWTSTPPVETANLTLREGTFRGPDEDTVSGTDNAIPERYDTLTSSIPETVPPARANDDAGRKSEAGLLGVMPNRPPANDDSSSFDPHTNRLPEVDAPKEASGPKEDWVLVSVGATQSVATIPASTEPAPVPSPDSYDAVFTSQLIPAADTAENSPPKSSPVEDTAAHSSLGRLFLRSNRGQGGVQKTRSVEKEADKEKANTGRLRHRGGMLQVLRRQKHSVD